MKLKVCLLLLLASLGVSAQRFGHMNPNRWTYVHFGGGVPYLGMKAGFEIQPKVYMELQGFTDGGGIWRDNVANDWRTLSLIRSVSIPSLKTEFRAGMGIVQSEERVGKQKADSFGAAPQFAALLHVSKNVAVGTSVTWPISPAAQLAPGILFGVEYRIGRYVKENGLH